MNGSDFFASQKDIDLAFQPVINLNTGSVFCYETLVRFPALIDGHVGQAVSVLEGEGKSLLLDYSVASSLLRFLNNIDFLEGSRIAMNLTGDAFSSRSFLYWFEQFLRKIHYPERLIVEMTESVPVFDPDQARSCFRLCHDFGVLVFLDDFGSGYSGFSLLSQFPFNGVKLDGGYVTNWYESEDSFSLARDLSKTARSERRILTAEFITSAEDLEMARDLGYHNGQGWLFGGASESPKPPSELQQDLRENGLFS